jgi:hypothetical protein
MQIFVKKITNFYSMIKRLSEFIKKQGISVRAFEQKISASDGMIRRAISNNTDIQCKWMANIADNYPQLNLEWLLTGNGQMLKEKQPVKEEKGEDTAFTQQIFELLKSQLEEKDRQIATLAEALREAIKNGSAAPMGKQRRAVKITH